MQINITTEYITLGQFLKFVGIIDCGSYAKQFLLENEVLINNEQYDNLYNLTIRKKINQYLLT